MRERGLFLTVLAVFAGGVAAALWVRGAAVLLGL